MRLNNCRRLTAVALRNKVLANVMGLAPTEEEPKHITFGEPYEQPTAKSGQRQPKIYTQKPNLPKDKNYRYLNHY